MQLALAPLQTYTDYHFRNAHQAVYGGVDKFYAPYLKMNNDGTIKSAPKIDVLPVNNPLAPIVPQLMACTVEDFFVMANYLEELGYTEVNWNMGCPYPMVTNRNLGAGILNKPDDLKRLLDTIVPRLNMQLGIKMRMGMDSTAEILDILPALNDYPLTEVIIHARYAKQLYNGGCDHAQFANCIALTKHPLTYNGDITSVEEFEALQQLFPGITNWMIGRGAMVNPALFEEIKTGHFDDSEGYRSRLLVFTEKLENSLIACNPDKGYALSKLKSYWEYLCDGLEDGNKLFRKLKKVKSLDEFQEDLLAFMD